MCVCVYIYMYIYVCVCARARARVCVCVDTGCHSLQLFRNRAHAPFGYITDQNGYLGHLYPCTRYSKFDQS